MEDEILLRSELKRLAEEVKRLTRRLSDLENRYDLEIQGELKGLLAEFRGETAGRLSSLEEEAARGRKRFLDSL